MNVKELIKEEQKFSFYEYQVKIKGSVTSSALRKLGAKELGSVIHEDIHLAERGKDLGESKDYIRIRKEGGEKLIFVYKGHVGKRKLGKRLIVKKVIKKPIMEKEMKEIMRNYKEVICVNKRRTIFLYKGLIISVDKVENLGDYLEFNASNEEDAHKIDYLMKKLGLNPSTSTTLSYFEIAMMNMSLFQRVMLRVHEKFGDWTFGIAAASLTALGMIVGVNSATASKLAVIAGIVAIAIADSSSDALGMYAQKKSERGTSKKTAFRVAFGAFRGKFLFTLTFIIPFLIFPLTIGIYANIIWGLLLIAFINVQIAFIQEEKISTAIVKNLIIAIIVIVVSYFAGRLIALWFGI